MEFSSYVVIFFVCQAVCFFNKMLRKWRCTFVDDDEKNGTNASKVFGMIWLISMLLIIA